MRPPTLTEPPRNGGTAAIALLAAVLLLIAFGVLISDLLWYFIRKVLP